MILRTVHAARTKPHEREQNMDDDAPASPSTTTTGALDAASVSSNESRESWPDVPLEPSDADFSGDVFVRRDNKRLGWRRCVGSLARDFGPGGAPRDGVAATLRLAAAGDAPPAGARAPTPGKPLREIALRRTTVTLAMKRAGNKNIPHD